MSITKACDWKSVLMDIYRPIIGSLWASPNGIWNNRFAKNKDENDCHPSVVGRVYEDGRRCWLIPGTSKDYNKGSDVYKVKINPEDDECPFTFFLIKFRMTYTSRDLSQLRRGWNGIEFLSDNQIKDFKLQIKFSLGIDV